MTFLEQLQQSAGLLQDQVTNLQPPSITNVPQNRFVGNQFQMPFNFGGSSYSPGNFTYTPGAFNQYGNIPVTGMLPPAISTTPPQEREGREGDRGAFGNQNNVSTEFVGNRGYRISPDGQVEQLDPESIDYQLNKLVFDAFNIAKINPFNPLGYIDSMSQRLDPDVMRQIQAFESANPQSLTFGPGVAQAVQDVFGTPEGPLGGVTPTDIQKVTGATPPGLLNRPVQLNINPLDLSLPTTPTVASLIEATQNLNQPTTSQPTPAQLGQTVAAIGKAGGRGEGKGDGGGKSCFVKGTMLQMADGTEKEISTVELGDNTKGGIVEMTMQGLPQTIYNYKDVLVSGSHWVIEDNEFVAVEDSKHGVLTDKVEPVYTLKTSDHRMWINDIEFGDFETGSDNDWEPHFEMVRQKLNKELRDGK